MGVARLVAWRRGDGIQVFEEGSAAVPPASGEERVGIDWSLLTVLLSTERKAPIVALGCDLGALSLALAKTCAMIITLDHHYQRIRLLESQRVQNAVANVFRVCGGNTGCLPFRDGSVGLTIVNQVKDRSSCSNDGDPVQIHASLLLEARRVLKAGGMLCLVVSQRGSGISPSELRALLSRCGFSNSEFYMAHPRRHRFTALAPIASGRAMNSCIDLFVQGNAFQERKRRAWLKILATLGLLQYLTPEYIVIGRKEI